MMVLPAGLLNDQLGALVHMPQYSMDACMSTNHDG